MFTRLVSLTHFWPIGALLGAPKGPFYEQMKSFCYPEKSQNSVNGVQNSVSCHDLSYSAFGSKFGHFGPSDGLFRGYRGHFRTIGGRKGFVLLIKWLFGGPEGFQWAINGNLVNIGQLDQTGSPLPLYGTFCTSGSLVRHQIWFQTLHNGPTGQCLLGCHLWPIGTLLGPPNSHFMSKTNPFRAPNCPKMTPKAPEKAIRWPKMSRFGTKCTI